METPATYRVGNVIVIHGVFPPRVLRIDGDWPAYGDGARALQPGAKVIDLKASQVSGESPPPRATP